ncbi:MAG: hypothetical protein Q9191_001526 [Dirinaria sp. TL-2023a]
MPFRERVKRAFGRSISEDGSNLTQTESKASTKKAKKPKTPNNVYKPGEVMPKQKYRGPVNKEHKEKLDAFSWGNAFRRRDSDQSQYSPMGSRLPSRRNSLFGRKSLVLRSRQPSHVEEPVMESTEADDDVTNVGLSRGHTREENQRPRTRDSDTMDPLQETQTTTKEKLNGHANGSAYGRPFTEDELTQAMTRTTLRPASAGKD